jgi:uncharacterized protein YaeQ
VLYRFFVELSDVDRGIYESLDFRLSQHPSETAPYLLSRALAYALSYQQGLEFSPAGLSDPDSPALLARGDHGNVDLWIEIGNPSARKLHKATKVAKQVKVYTYKNPDVLVAEIKSQQVHRADEIQIFSLNEKYLSSLEPLLEKNNRWTLLYQQGQIDIGVGSQVLTGQVQEVF